MLYLPILIGSVYKFKQFEKFMEELYNQKKKETKNYEN